MDNPFETLESRLSQIEKLLLDLSINNTIESQQNSIEHPMSVKETANFLNLSIPTIYSKTSRGELPFMKKDKKCYFFKSELVDYIKEGRKNTNSDYKKIAEEYVQKGGS